MVLRNKILKLVLYRENDFTRHLIHTGKSNLKLLATTFDFMFSLIIRTTIYCYLILESFCTC